jgi:hypothetical protein
MASPMKPSSKARSRCYASAPLALARGVANVRRKKMKPWSKSVILGVISTAMILLTYVWEPGIELCLAEKHPGPRVVIR